MFILWDDGVLAYGTQPDGPRSALHVLQRFFGIPPKELQHSWLQRCEAGREHLFEGNPPSLRGPWSAQPKAETLELLGAYMSRWQLWVRCFRCNKRENARLIFSLLFLS